MSLGNMKDLFGQFKDAQKHMKEMQKEMSNIRVESETGGGMVKATVDGEAFLVDLKIDTSLLEQDEIKILPNLIQKAVYSAQKKAKDQMAHKIQSMAGNINIPGFNANDS